jgi:hypothetical protein
MTKELAEIRLDARIAETIETALRSSVCAAPILNEFHRVLADILAASREDEGPQDAKIRDAIARQLDRTFANGLIKISVHDGNVQLLGLIPSESCRKRLHAIAESAPGVKAVHDHLTQIDLTSGTFMRSSEDSVAA